MQANSTLPVAPFDNSRSSASDCQERSGMAERWLRCQVFKGMFSDELAVRYAPPEAVQAKATSVFVPREAVRGEVDQEGRVRVSVFHERGAGWAVLPTENQLVICVAESDLTSS